MSRPPHAPPRPLYKQQSWSPDMIREEAWQRRKESHVISNRRHKLNKSLSDDDLEELKACIELGFGFDSPKFDPKLSNTIPALTLYHAVNKQYNNHTLFRSSSTSSLASESHISSSNNIIFNKADDLAVKKTRLKQWAQVVACAVRHSQSSPSLCSQNSDQINTSNHVHAHGATEN
ncbi:hypothetical protein Lal_00025729 [Lupinus albus]|uniref:Uncharacterized protein n=1 Tax=Lupinus albus TaxID=3870 RepID=A0A6A5LMN9_LUPAL|nr:hypothetical protein Lalb_Chr09g0328361 [Lupinus albus]KAF1861418.1 hypothetical protein Lal_00025729 [Lupinus albus]